MEGGDVRLWTAAQPPSDPIAHFARGPAPEGEYQDLGRGDIGNPGSDGFHDRGGLPRAGSGEHEQGATGVIHHRPLVDVKDRGGRGGRNREVEPPFHGPMDSRWL